MPFTYIEYLIYFISGSTLITAITLIAEKKSPKIAGILMSLPVITVLSLLFLALVQGADFSSRAAVWNPVGAIADLAYMGLFAVGISMPEYLGKNKYENVRNKMIVELLFGLLFGFTGYFILIFISSRFSVTNGFVSLGAL